MSPVIFEYDCMCFLKKMRLTIDINTYNYVSNKIVNSLPPTFN